ncbi:MAG: ATP-binding protein [candidate division WOR-3 bacterium]
MKHLTVLSAVLGLLILAVFNIHSWLVLRQTSRTLEQELGDRLLSVARTLALEIGNAADTAQASRLLSRALAENQLFNLFIVDETWTYLVNIRQPDLVGSTDPVLELDEAELAAALSGNSTLSRLYRAGRYFLKSAYVPLFDSLGVPVAVLGAEADARFSPALLGFRRSLLLTNGLGLLALLAIVLISLTVTRRIMALEQAAVRANTLALMGQMSATLAHEIRNPLAIIMAAAERLRLHSDSASGNEARYIFEEAERLNHILTNHLALGSTRPRDIEPVNIVELLGEALASIEPETRRLGIKIETTLADLPPVKANKLALRQSFLNILFNAIQAQPQGGLIRVSGTVETSARHRFVLIRIEDRGQGLADADRRRLFEPFYTTKEKGTGLGLYVVKRVIENHHGQVRLAPSPEGGTVVEVRLPL